MKKKVMFVIPSLAGGGAEKVLNDLLRHLDKDKYAISLALFEKKGVYLSNVPGYVKIYDLKKKNRYSFFKLVIQMTKLIREIKPNTVLSFMSYTNIAVVLSKLLSSYRFNLVIAEHTHLESDLAYARYRKVKKFLYQRLFNYANLIVVPSAGIKQHLVKIFGSKEEKIRIISNPLNPVNINRFKNEVINRKVLGKYILAIGRLTKEKNFSLLLKAYALIHEDIEEKLVILGEGEDKEACKKLAKNLGIHKRVLFPGFQKNPYKFMKNASIFVLSSLWESFAIVLAEAMACGTPVISTDCPSGPNEIITNDKNGILVPSNDEKALAQAMLHLLNDKNLRIKFSKAGKKRASDFRIEKILPQYEELFSGKIQ